MRPVCPNASTATRYAAPSSITPAARAASIVSATRSQLPPSRCATCARVTNSRESETLGRHVRPLQCTGRSHAGPAKRRTPAARPLHRRVGLRGYMREPAPRVTSSFWLTTQAAAVPECC
jgi:hypothetical protein